MTDLITAAAVALLAGATIVETITRNRERRDAASRHVTLARIVQAANANAIAAREAAETAKFAGSDSVVLLMALSNLDELDMNGRCYNVTENDLFSEEGKNLPETDGCNE